MEQNATRGLWRLKCECGHQFTVSRGKADASVTCPACDREIPVSPGPTPTPQAQAREASEPPKRPCPFCLEPVHPRARKCPFCQEYLDPQLATPPAPAGVPPTSGLAVAALVMGVLGPVTLCLSGIPAAILGIAGLLATRGGRRQGKGMAIAGLLMGILWTLLLVGLVGLAVAAAKFGGHIQFPTSSPAEPLF